MLSSSGRRICCWLRASHGCLIIILINLLVSADVASSLPCLHSLQGCGTEKAGSHTGLPGPGFCGRSLAELSLVSLKIVLRRQVSLQLFSGNLEPERGLPVGCYRSGDGGNHGVQLSSREMLFGMYDIIKFIPLIFNCYMFLTLFILLLFQLVTVFIATSKESHPCLFMRVLGCGLTKVLKPSFPAD